MIPNVPEEFDWIAARDGCTMAIVFERLVTEIQGDVDGFNATHEGQRRFKVVRDREHLSVFQDGLLIGSRQVLFKCLQCSISVSSSLTNEPIIATVMVNDYGKCCLRVNDKELRNWQFRRDALEELFFGPL